MTNNQLLDSWTKGCNFLGSKYPIMGGAMSWVSEHNLVAAISNAGGFGILATGALTKEQIKEEVRLVRKLTSMPFGVNYVTMRPDLDELLKQAVDLKLSHVILAGGIAKAKHINYLNEHNVKVICFAPSASLAKRQIKSGVDAIIIEGNEAGGHIGPITTSILMQEIIPEIENQVPVFVAGGVGSPKGILSAIYNGANGVQAGTIFVCAEESIAHPNLKEKYIKASAKNTIVTTQIDKEFPVIPVRVIENESSKEFNKLQQEVIADYRAGKISKHDATLKIEYFWSGALKRAVIDGDIQTGSLMAGQSVGFIKEIKPVSDIIQELVSNIKNKM